MLVFFYQFHTLRMYLDKNHSGLLSVKEASKDPVFLSFANYTGNIPNILNPKNNTDEDSAYVSINKRSSPHLLDNLQTT